MSNSKQPTIAITGANGFLGSVLGAHFVRAGWHVIGLVRQPSAMPKNGVKYRAYDITKRLDTSTLQGADYVVHTACVKYGQKNPDAMEVNVNGAKNLLAACKQQHVKKALFISTMSAHDEATSIYGRQKLAIEQLFAKAGGVALRSGLILGDGGIVKDMAAFMKTKHVVPVIGGGKQPLQTIGVHDLARVVEAALAKDVTGVLTVANPKVYTYKAFYKTLAKHLDTPVLFVPVPYYALLAMFNLAAVLRVPLDLGADNLRGLRQLRSADTTHDLRRLGVEIDDLPTTLNKINNIS